MWARKRLDITWPDLLHALAGCMTCWDRTGAQAAVEQTWSADGDALACLSVRSAFDLLLAAAKFPSGSEVLVSAMTIPDMARIIGEHGLVPVPLDLDPESALPTPDQIAARITPQTRAVLIAHLFGTAAPLDAHIAVAREHNLLFIEDCAQAFRGGEYRGHPQADASLFSFGTIKSATALGGAIGVVRDRGLLDDMRRRQATYPVQSRAGYLQRVVKYMALQAASYRLPLSCLIGLLRLVGKDHDRLMNSFVRGFAADRLFSLIRQQPCAPLLRLLTRRLQSFDTVRQEYRAARGKRLATALRGSFASPGADVSPHVFWVFPILTEQPQVVRDELFRHGLDATQGQSMIVVDPPAGRADLAPCAARRMLSQIVYLPFYDALPDAELERMALVLNSIVQRQGCLTPPASRSRCDPESSPSPQRAAP